MRHGFLPSSLFLVVAATSVLGCKGSDTPTVTPGKKGEVLQRDAVIPGSPNPSSPDPASPNPSSPNRNPGSPDTSTGRKSENATGGREVKASGRAMDREIPK